MTAEKTTSPHQGYVLLADSKTTSRLDTIGDKQPTGACNIWNVGAL